MKATFSAGCFWHVQEAFDKVKGVVKTTVGYTGGTVENPTYEQVSSHATGHAESVLVEYDPKIISYRQLLEVFWNMHDPTSLNRQGLDFGSQYRSAIFYHNKAQEKEANESKEQLEKSGKRGRPIVTEIAKATKFYPAEEYHQEYYKKKVCGL